MKKENSRPQFLQFIVLALLGVIAILIPCKQLQSQVVISPLVAPRKQFFDASGRPLAGGHICTYTVGSSTPQVTFTDYTGATPNPVCDPLTDPVHSDGIILDAGGYASIYVNCTLSPLKVVAYDQNLVLQWSEDGVAYPTCIQPQACPAGEFMIELLPDGKTFDCAAPPAPSSICTDLTQVTNLYVNYNTGNDTTGDGTSGLPWKTIQKAIDAGIPGIVCGRYIIHLQVATTYVGAVRLDGRIFAGGGGFADDALGYPIVNTTPTPNEYSWVEILGNTTNSSTYIIQEHAADTVGGYVITVAGGNLTLKGVTVRLGAFGVHATKGAFVNLAAVKFENNSVGVMGTEQSVIHIDNNVTVDDGGTENVLVTNNNVAAAPYTGVDAIEIADGSFLTDFLSDGNNTDTGAIIHYDKGTGTLSIACIEMKYASMYFRGTINCEVSGITALSSNLAVQTYNFDGLAPNTGTALSLRDSIMSGQVFGGGLYTITNASVAVRLQGAASVSPYPNIVSATTSFIAEGGDTIPPNMRSRDTFMSTAHLIDTVTFSATPAFNMNTNGSIKKITLTGDVTSSTITNQRPGESVTFVICQDGTGGHTFAWPANVRGEEAIGATLSTCSTQQFTYDQGATAWLAVAPMVKNQ